MQSRKPLLLLVSLEPRQPPIELTDAEDRLLVIVGGAGEAVIDCERMPLRRDMRIYLPGGTRCSVVNTGREALHLYAVSPPAARAPRPRPQARERMPGPDPS